MERVIFILSVVLLATFVVYDASSIPGAFAKVAQVWLPTKYYDRRPSPAWIQFTEEKIGAPDVKALCRRIWAREGYRDREEWDAMVVMNEVHGHIGPWSIVGCKMGLRALWTCWTHLITKLRWSAKGATYRRKDVLRMG